MAKRPPSRIASSTKFRLATRRACRGRSPGGIELFAAMSGDVNPAHVDAEFAKNDMFHRIIAHGMWGGALISTVLGTELLGPGTIHSIVRAGNRAWRYSYL
jgi:acyl dehydratase